MKYTFKHTTYACYTGYITQAIVNNLAPLLFIIFQNEYGLSFEQVGRLILFNFGMQIITDLVAVKYVDRIGYRRAAVLAHMFAVIGLISLGVLPHVFSNPYSGFMLAVMIYAVGGGLLEVLVSPIVESLPGEEKDRTMSLLHSFYCWGQVAVVLITTLLIKVFGSGIWPMLPVLWAVIPFFNMFFFSKVPLVSPVHEKQLMSVKQLIRSKPFMVALVLMLCAGASELSMSQWSSLFAEKGLHVSKMMGDLLGPCLFAVLMGIGRAIYGIWGNKINLKKAMIGCSILCVACYLTTIFSPHPVISLLGCAVCGISISLFWPGTFSLTAEKFPMGGTAMFGMMAVAGDLGGSIGPWLTGMVSDLSQKSGKVMEISDLYNLDLSQIGLRCGLLVAMLFPVIMFGGLLVFRKIGKNKNKNTCKI